MNRGPILIVDDDQDIREILAETLEEQGFDVITAANGLAALELIRSLAAPPSVILLDLMMPVMDGYSFLEHRKNDPAIASVPVAVVTAGHGVDHARLGDGSRIVSKPFQLPQLVRLLHELRSQTGVSA